MAEPFSEAQLEDFRAAYVTAAEDSAITVRDAGRLLATIDQLQADLKRAEDARDFAQGMCETANQERNRVVVVGDIRTRERNEAWDRLNDVRRLPDRWRAEAENDDPATAMALLDCADELERALGLEGEVPVES